MRVIDGETAFTVETLPDGQIVVTEHFDDGAAAKCTFNSAALADSFIRHRRQIRQDCLDATLRRWNREEARERRKLGLEVKADYSVIHFGTAEEAACGVEKGVAGNIHQEVVDHSTDVSIAV